MALVPYSTSKILKSFSSKMMCVFRRVLDEARKLGLMSGTDYTNAIELTSIRDTRKLRGRALSQSEITALMRVCSEDHTKIGARDAAPFVILRSAGLRRVELVKLKVTNFSPETGQLEINKAKGGKNRLVYLPQQGITYVEHCLNIRTRRPRALLCPIRKGGKIEFRHLSSQTVLLVLQKRAKQAGIESFSPHDFRRTFCSNRRGEEIKRQAVQNLKF